jgi:hypothetical protein
MRYVLYLMCKLTMIHFIEKLNSRLMSSRSVLLKFRQSRTTSQVVGAHADLLHKIPHNQTCVQVNRRNIIGLLVVKVAVTIFFN